MLSSIITVLYYVIPAAAVLLFGISLFRYCYAGNKNRRSPGAFSPEQLRSRKICLIVSAVIAGVLLAVVLAFVGLLMLAVAFM